MGPRIDAARGLRVAQVASLFGLAAIGILGLAACCQGADPATRAAAEGALQKAVKFFREEVSAEGGYLWRYSGDLKAREGEEKASVTTAWIQPPGTPAVGEALLTAYERTGDTYCLDAAKETAGALVKGQLRSGGWADSIEFNPQLRQKIAYRVDGESGGKQFNTTTLDDNKTQSALRFLMRLDATLARRDATIHEAVQYGLAALLAAQFPNGAWPQRFSEPPVAADYPVKQASYPETWSRTFPNEKYSGFYTLNDNSLADTAAVLFEAARIYDEPKYRAAAARAGDFLLLSQMPQPQSAWAQQYDRDMHPAWARKFEPASVTGGESQGAIKLLMHVYRETGERKYLAAIPPALAYLRASQLPDGRLARFYELQTNKPLYFTKKYELTYRSDDMPTHYSFIVGSNLDKLAADYERLAAADPAQLRSKQLDRARKPEKVRLTPELEKQAQAAIAALDARGAWVEKGSLRAKGNAGLASEIIDCKTFIKNVDTLSRYLAATR